VRPGFARQVSSDRLPPPTLAYWQPLTLEDVLPITPEAAIAWKCANTCILAKKSVHGSLPTYLPRRGTRQRGNSVRTAAAGRPPAEKSPMVKSATRRAEKQGQSV
jgi:hypothetical protein